MPGPRAVARLDGDALGRRRRRPRGTGCRVAAGRAQQHGERAAAGGGGEGVVVGVEQVVALEERLDPVAGRRRRPRRRGARPRRAATSTPSASVTPSTSMRRLSVARAAAGVGDRGPDVQAAAPGLDGEPADGPVGRRARRRCRGRDPGGIRRCVGVGEAAVGEEVEADRRRRRSRGSRPGGRPSAQSARPRGRLERAEGARRRRRGRGWR